VAQGEAGRQRVVAVHEGCVRRGSSVVTESAAQPKRGNRRSRLVLLAATRTPKKAGIRHPTQVPAQRCWWSRRALNAQVAGNQQTPPDSARERRTMRCGAACSQSSRAAGVSYAMAVL